MSDHHREDAEGRAPATTPGSRRGLVPPGAVVPPRHARHALGGVRPEHLYKAVGLLFLFAVLFHYLEPLLQVALLGYAAAIAAVVFNALVQVLPGRRSWMTVLLGLGILGTVAVLLWIGIPLLFAQLRSLVSQVPELTDLLSGIEQWLRINTGINVTLVGPRGQEILRDAILGTAGGGRILAQAQGVLEILLVPILILFGGLYAAGDPNQRLLSPLLRAVPRDRRLAARRVLQLLGVRLLGWVRGVLLGMAAVGILSFVGYWLAGVPNAFALALFASLTEAIPLVGPWIGGAAAVAVGLLHSPTTGLYAGIVALAVQQIENNLLIPWVMAQSAQVHPFVTLFALVLFGALFGFLGVLLSIPIVLLIWTLVEVLWVERTIDTDQDPIEPLVDG